VKALDRQAITGLLHRWSTGDRRAAEEFTPIVYDELRRIAAGQMRGERDGHTLQATAVVHEAYIRLVEANGVQWKNRFHFFALCARVMRRVLVDHARARQCEKRGGAVQRVTLNEVAELGSCRPVDLVELDEALSELASFDPEMGTIVELRFFGGLSIGEVAQHLGVSESTVNRRWRRARAWLYSELVG